MALDRVVFALALHLLALHLLALALFALSVGHLFLALALNEVPLSGIPLAFAVQRLRGRMLHRLPNSRQRVTRSMRWTRAMLSIC